MSVDRSFVDLNRKSTERIRALVRRLSEKELKHAVGEHWTVAIALAHLAFWEGRVLRVLDLSSQEGKFVPVEPDIVLNDISLPLWAAIPPREAARLAIEACDTVDKRLESCPADQLEQIYSYNQRWVVRALHRNEHLDQVDAGLKI
jgi:hypothetical protein